MHFSRLLSAVLLSGLSLSASASAYYLSSSGGSDAYSASRVHDPATPWKSLHRLADVLPDLKPGDSVLFKRGDVFFGELRLTASGAGNRPIYFGAYGDGNAPVIEGFRVLTGWRRKEGNIWEAPCGGPACGNGGPVNMVLLDGQDEPIGRYPNADAPAGGYLTIDSVSAAPSITGDRLSLEGDWAGAEIVIRKNHWVLDRNRITGHTGRTIVYTSGSPNAATRGFGYFVQNHPRTLDQRGEWYYTAPRSARAGGNAPETGRLGILLPAGPARSTVKVSCIDTLVSVFHADNLVFDGLSLQGAGRCALCVRNAFNITVSRCDLLFSGTDAVHAVDADHLVLLGNRIDHTHNVAYSAVHCSGCLLNGNTISYTGMTPGMGSNDSGSYEAIMSDGDDDIFEYNEIDHTGYIPVTFSGNRVLIRHNLIDHYTLVKDDGGGIYTWNNAPGAQAHSGCRITGNILLDGTGAGAGTDRPAEVQAYGVYLDDHSSDVAVDSNTIVRCGRYGIYIHNAQRIDIRNNTVFDNLAQLGMVQDGAAAGSPVERTRTLSNVFFSRTAAQLAMALETNGHTVRSFGTFDSNCYCRPLGGNDLLIGASIRENGQGLSTVQDLAGWQKTTGEDLHSHAAPLIIRPYLLRGSRGPDRFPNGRFDKDIGGLYCYSDAHNASVRWAREQIAGEQVSGERASGEQAAGGALEVSFKAVTGSSGAGGPAPPPSGAAGSAAVIIGIGSLEAGRQYIVRYSIKGSGARNLEVFLRKSLAPYNDLSARQPGKTGGLPSKNEILLTASGTEPDASLVFNIPAQADPVYLDDISLFEADVLAVRPERVIRFEYNAAKAGKTITLDGVYTDAAGRACSGEVSLAPYSSVILIKKN